MQLLLVCLLLGTPVLAAGPPLQDVDGRPITASFSMPVQFSMAAPLFNNPQEQLAQQPESEDWSVAEEQSSQHPESQDWLVSEPSQSLSHRRGHFRPSHVHRRKHPHAEHYRIPEEIHPSRRRRPPPHELSHHRRVHPRYPPFLEPYSHNYRLNHPMHSSSYYHHYRPEGHHQHNSYDEFPPYASRYQSPSQSEIVSSHSHIPSNIQYQPHVSNHQFKEPQTHLPQNQFSSNYDPQSQSQSPQSSHVEYPQYSSNYHTGEQQSNSHSSQIPNTRFPQHPSDYESSGPMQSPHPHSHQATSFEYPPLPSHYPIGEISQHTQSAYPEPHASPHQPPEYTGYGGRYPVSRPYSHAALEPEYTSSVPKELIDLNREINQPGGESHKSIFHLLLPLLMVGISIPAIGYMYTHMVRRRSNDGITWPWVANESLEAYMQLFERGLQCHQHGRKCS